MNSNSTDKVNNVKTGTVYRKANKLAIKQENSNYTTPASSEEKDEYTAQVDKALFAHDPMTRTCETDQLSQQLKNPNILSSETPFINFIHDTSPFSANDADSQLPNESFLPNVSSSFLQNPITQLDSLLLTSEKDRSKRVSINVGGVKHEGR